MIIVRTPFRISFFGGGTDYPAWYQQHGGVVLATTIDKYCYISCRYLPPFFEHKYRLVYSRIETVKHFAEIEHPSARAVLGCTDLDAGLEIHHDGDLPARSGLGSSSSFTVSLLHALAALRGAQLSKTELAQNAIHIEQNILKEHVGSQDQISAAFGGFNRIEFKKEVAPPSVIFSPTGDAKGGLSSRAACEHDGIPAAAGPVTGEKLPETSFQVHPVIINSNRLQELQQHLMLFFTGFSRIASEIAKSKIENFAKREQELKAMTNMVDEAMQILQTPDTPITTFGELLHQNWLYKRKLSDKISTPAIDNIYADALAAGAIGGKILGAGGGGFLLLFVKPQLQQAVRQRLAHLIHVPFAFENSGSRVVLYQPNGLS